MTEKKIKADITIKDAKIDIKSKDAEIDIKNIRKLSNKDTRPNETFITLLDKKTCENKCENKCETCEKKCETCEKCSTMQCFIKLCCKILRFMKLMVCPCKIKNKKKYPQECLLTLYLNLVIPDWREMEDDRLYKHAQKVLDNIEGIRRFEIELLWKRSAYMIGLVIALFVAFGQIATAEDDFIIAGIHKDFLLLIISLINSYISFCFALINIGSRKWQRNWEIHADYLHEILGSKLMRMYFHKKGNFFTKCFTIGKINVAIGFFMTLFWLCISAFLALKYIHGCESIINSPWWLVAIPISIVIAHLLSCLFKTRDREFKLDPIYFAEEARIFRTENPPAE